MSADWIGYLIGLFGGWFSSSDTDTDDNDTDDNDTDDSDSDI